MKYVILPIIFILRTIWRSFLSIGMILLFIIVNSIILLWNFNTKYCIKQSEILDLDDDHNDTIYYCETFVDFILKRNYKKRKNEISS